MSTDFDKKGFLSDFVFSHRDNVLAEYAGAFTEVASTSEEAQALLLGGVRDDRPYLICAFLFAERAVRSCQAAIRLCELGLIQEAQVLIRTGLETMFHTAALIAKPEVFSAIEVHDGNEDFKYVSAIKAHAKLDDLSDANRAFLDRHDRPRSTAKFTAYESAQIAGMSEIYSVQYRGLSGLAGHATFRSLDRTFMPEGSEYAFQMGPSTDQLIFTLSVAAICLRNTIASLRRIAEINLE